jgi:hypothetical protein
VKPGDDVPHTPPTDWSQIPAHLWAKEPRNHYLRAPFVTADPDQLPGQLELPIESGEG